MNVDRFLHNILSDLRVELAEEFDRNFERKSFFGSAWPGTKMRITKGSLLLRTGALRQSIDSTVAGNTLRFSSSLRYASIHNEGGTLTVTPKMKKYFWAMFYKASGAIPKKKNGESSRSQKAVALTADAAFWKNMALMKVGAKIKIPERRFLGHHPNIDGIVKEIADDNFRELAASITAELQRGAARFR